MWTHRSADLDDLLDNLGVHLSGGSPHLVLQAIHIERVQPISPAWSRVRQSEVSVVRRVAKPTRHDSMRAPAVTAIVIGIVRHVVVAQRELSIRSI